MKTLLKQRMKRQVVGGNELFFLKVLSMMVVKEEDRKQLPPVVVEAMEQEFPDGTELSRFAERVLGESGDMLEVYETIQLLCAQINCDQEGRQLLKKTLKKFMLSRRRLRSAYPGGESEEYSDIYEHLSEEEVDERYFAQHYFEQRIVRNYYDLMLPCVKVLSRVCDDLFGYAYDIYNELRLPMDGEQIDEPSLSYKQDRLDQDIKSLVEQQLTLRDQLSHLKRNSQQYHATHKLLLQVEDNIRILEQQLGSLSEEIVELDTHSFYLLDAMLSQCEFESIP